MASSPCDQKKAEIIRLVQKECTAETDTAKAIYDLECLEIKENYKSKIQQACRDLNEQESKELAEKKRLYDAKMVPIKKRHTQKLAEAQQKYRSVSLEANPLPSALAGAPRSPDLAAMDGEDDQRDSTLVNNFLNEADDSSDQSSIPAVMPKITKEATTKARFALHSTKRKRRASLESGSGDRQTDDGPQSVNEVEEDNFSDFTFQDSPIRSSQRALKKFKRTRAQKAAQRPASSAPPERMKNGLDQDGDESMHSGPDSAASQSPRPRRGTRHGRPEPGKYKMGARAFPNLNGS
ncbi:hypothetical protein KVR01_006519 [Diaporthe batatas]|uniref:uncharacterized protein n=1 Tax=Diaporthe batatas TaxID=748121 RepID=UPI001D041898|nr:uncharacterized protein KVR01_006519 [Diaporthe batatas]KAG8163222.1 hypothetical protein KVR01_006519 [Diaporthe batatas]